MDNLELWNKVCRTDPKHTKKTKLGAMAITAIDPQYQRKNATEVFGPFGCGWGVENESFSTETFKDGTVLGNYSATMWFLWESEGKLPICSNIKVAYTTSTGKYKVDDEWMKKAATDALTKGLSMIGFNSDVFEGKFDDNKYVKQMEEEHKPKPKPKKTPQDHALEAILKAQTVEELITLVGKFEASDKLEYDDALKKAVEARRVAIGGK